MAHGDGFFFGSFLFTSEQNPQMSSPWKTFLLQFLLKMSEGPKQILDKIEKLTDEPSKEQTTELPKPVSSLTNSSGLMAKAWVRPLMNFKSIFMF